MAGRSGGGSRSRGRSSSGRSSGLGRSSSGRSMGSRSGAGRSLGSSGSNRSRNSGGLGSSGGLGGLGRIGGFGNRGPSFGSIYGRNRSYGGYMNHRQGNGCFTSVLLIGLILIFFFFLLTSSLSSCSRTSNYENDITPNRTQREALVQGLVKETPYYEDNLNWISNATKLTVGLKNFYQLTGIQPYILLEDSIGNNPSDNDIDDYANNYYDKHFEDEAHLLFLYIEDIDYMYGIVGSQGLTIMDQEAWDILFDYVERYFGSDLDEDELFSAAFHEAGIRIMSDPNASDQLKTERYKYVIIAIIVIAILFFLTKIKKDKDKQKAQEAKDLKDILDKPLETFGNNEVDDLMNKYDK